MSPLFSPKTTSLLTLTISAARRCHSVYLLQARPPQVNFAESINEAGWSPGTRTNRLRRRRYLLLGTTFPKKRYKTLRFRGASLLNQTAMTLPPVNRCSFQAKGGIHPCYIRTAVAVRAPYERV